MKSGGPSLALSISFSRRPPSSAQKNLVTCEHHPVAGQAWLLESLSCLVWVPRMDL
jgi:hypothetical protein